MVSKAARKTSNVIRDRDTIGFMKLATQCYLSNRRKVVEDYWFSVEDRYLRRLYSKRYDYPKFVDQLVFSQIEPPRVNQLANTLAATTFNQRPKFFVEPVTKAQNDVAEWGETATNAEWQRDHAINSEIRRCGFDEAMYGWGIAYTGVKTDYVAAVGARKQRQRDALKEKSLAERGLIPDDYYESAEVHMDWTPTTVENDDRIRRDRIFTVRIDPWRFVIDPAATDPENAKWMGVWCYMDEASVLDSPDFDPVAKKRVEFGNRMDEDVLSVASGDPYKYAKIWEMWFKQPDGTWNLRIYWDGETDDGMFLYKHDNPYAHGCPFRIFRATPTGRSIWGVAAILPVYQQIVMESEITTRMFDALMRRGEDVLFVDGEAMSQDEMQPFTIPDVGLMIPIKNVGGRPLTSFFQRLESGQVNTEAITFLQLLQQQIEDGVGLGANQLGQFGKSETSATEAGNVQKWADIRGSIRNQHAEEFVGQIAHDRLKLMAQFYPAELMRQLGGEDASKLWRLSRFTDGDIQWGLNVKVVPGSMQPPSDQQRLQLATTMLTAAQQPGSTAGYLVNQPEVYKFVFKLLGLNDGSRLLNPGVDSDMLTEAHAMAATQGGGGGGGASAPAPVGSSNAEMVRA